MASGDPFGHPRPLHNTGKAVVQYAHGSACSGAHFYARSMHIYVHDYWWKMVIIRDKTT
jgi:hypothetical protein